MINIDIDSYRRKHFMAKKDQLITELDRPLLLFWGKWNNPNIRALTLCEEFTRPTFILVKPDGETTAFMQQIEADEMSPLDGLVESVSYKTVTDLRRELQSRLAPGSNVLVDISDKHWGFDLLSPQYLDYLRSVYEVSSAQEVLLPWRAVKMDTELYLMKEAALTMLDIFERIGNAIGDGVPEAEIVKLVRIAAIESGGTDAFWPIIAAGPRSISPHPARESANIMRKGDRLIVDYGVVYMGYRSDMTRSYIVGGSVEDDPYYPASKAVWEFTEAADLSGYNLLSFGRAITDVIRGFGLEGLLRHGHGHGLGVETHDPYPYIIDVETPYSADPFIEGLVFTMEPGFYEEKGGFRFEDDYVVRNGKAIRLQDLDITV